MMWEYMVCIRKVECAYIYIDGKIDLYVDLTVLGVAILYIEADASESERGALMHAWLREAGSQRDA